MRPPGGGVARWQADIVALLEERPYATQELAAVLGVPSGMHQVCVALARRRVIARELGGPWTLASEPPPLGGANRPRVKNQQHKPTSVEGGRSLPTVAAPVMIDKRTLRTIDGQDYEIVSDCSGPVTADWPSGSGSSLSGEFGGEWKR